MMRHLFYSRLSKPYFPAIPYFQKILFHDHLPRITVPQKMVRRIEKKIESKKKHQVNVMKMQRRHGKILISAKRPQFNVHRGQKFNEADPKSLISHGWKHYKSKGDHFTIQTLGHIPALRDLEDTSFTDLGLSDEVVKVLQKTGIERPVNIQCSTIPTIIEDENVLCTAETGSGKTLAYLLPIIHSIVESRKHVISDNQPHAVILLPTKELVEQLETVMKPFASELSINVKTLCKDKKSEKQSSVDILISTPGACLKAVKYGGFNLTSTKYVVLDEADTLLDDSFHPYILKLLETSQVQVTNIDTPDLRCDLGSRVILVGATVPRDLQGIIGDILPVDSFTKVSTPFLHRLPPHVTQKFLRIGPDDRPEAITNLVKNNVKSKIPTIVFCNKSSTAHYLGHIFEDDKLNHTLLTGKMPSHVRDGRFGVFQNGETDVLVTTDIASRGLDTIRAQHVVSYEFPAFMSDYIHRIGRVGRLGSKKSGFALNYISYKYDVELLWQIETAARRAAELHNINANIKRKLVNNSIKSGKPVDVDYNGLSDDEDDDDDIYEDNG